MGSVVAKNVMTPTASPTPPPPSEALSSPTVGPAVVHSAEAPWSELAVLLDMEKRFANLRFSEETFDTLLREIRLGCREPGLELKTKHLLEAILVRRSMENPGSITSEFRLRVKAFVEPPGKQPSPELKILLPGIEAKFKEKKLSDVTAFEITQEIEWDTNFDMIWTLESILASRTISDPSSILPSFAEAIEKLRGIL